MKKVLCTSVLLAMCFLTACTKNYKTVQDYDADMKNVRNKHQSYTIEVKQHTNAVDLYYKSYIKDDRWKLETSMNGGESYMSNNI